MTDDSAALMLGDVLAAARRGTGMLADWLANEDPALLARVTAATGGAGNPVHYARDAIVGFVEEAGDTDWTQLLSAARNGADPGLAALGTMLRWQLTRDTVADTARKTGP